MSRPAPRARRARQLDDETDFFVRRVPQLPQLESDSDQEELYHKAPAKSSPKREAHVSNSSPDARPSPTPIEHRSRSVSVTPPPDPGSDIVEYARDAVERVVNSQRPVSVDPIDEPDTSNDTLELNAGLARYYRGDDAALMRERALQRERELQLERAKHAPKRTAVETIEVIDSDDDGVQVLSESENETQPEVPRQEASAEPFAKDDTAEMSLTLHSADGKEQVVRVRRTTTISKISEHFARTFSLAHVSLSFEGERLAPEVTIGDTELEDEDLLEVLH